ncbi:MAG: hypothetical protein JMN24_10645 [gamma proteobacterium endosymbiont of Lamellibrachia anaximandri]|nr:hypothetical protein [gamma proteobacterium endosymbiont of Lamellibrachia anaximandri]
MTLSRRKTGCDTFSYTRQDWRAYDIPMVLEAAVRRPGERREERGERRPEYSIGLTLRL